MISSVVVVNGTRLAIGKLGEYGKSSAVSSWYSSIRDADADAGMRICAREWEDGDGVARWGVQGKVRS